MSSETAASGCLPWSGTSASSLTGGHMRSSGPTLARSGKRSSISSRRLALPLAPSWPTTV